MIGRTTPPCARAPALTGVLVAAAIALAGCGGDEPATAPGGTASQAIPHSLRVVESGAEDTTDFVLAGRRAKAIGTARALDEAARGPAARDLAAAGVAPARIDELRRRAASVARIARRGAAIDVALAANRAFALVPDLFAVYDDPVPPDVTRLDYFDFEAKLQALAGHRTATARAARGLGDVWRRLRERVVAAGGTASAAHFTAHVAKLRNLARSRAGRDLAAEAQHGLDLVDELERVFASGG